MKDFKSGFVAIVGRTNVGKSTLINKIVNEKIAIATRKPQTTRTAIRAILNSEDSQIIFVDTPGIHKPKTKLGNVMTDTAYNSLKDADTILFVVEADSLSIGKGDAIILEKIKESKKPTILIINKIDLIEKEKLLLLIEMFSKEYDFKSIIPISALRDNDVEKVLKEVKEMLPIGPKYYDDSEYTDQTERQLVEEIVREKALKLLNHEVPHGVFVEVDKMKFRKTKNNEQISDIDVNIFCSKNSHKGIIIGKNGEMLKRIGTYARQDLEKMLNMKVNLTLWVKVKENWQDMDQFIGKYKN